MASCDWDFLTEITETHTMQDGVGIASCNFKATNRNSASVSIPNPFKGWRGISQELALDKQLPPLSRQRVCSDSLREPIVYIKLILLTRFLCMKFLNMSEVSASAGSRRWFTQLCHQSYIPLCGFFSLTWREVNSFRSYSFTVSWALSQLWLLVSVESKLLKKLVLKWESWKSIVLWRKELAKMVAHPRQFPLGFWPNPLVLM